MVLVQKWPFLQLFLFRQNSPGKVLLRYSTTKKRLSRLQKQEVQKVEKLTFFQTGHFMVLVQKWPCFEAFFLGYIGQENDFYDILDRQNAFQGYKNKKFKNSKNWHFSKRVKTWFRSKNGHFSNCFFSQYRPGKFLLRYSRTKNTFLGYKNKKFKKSKNRHFFKGVNPWFWSKNGHFSNFFCLRNISLQNVFYDILERKNAFLGYKNKKFKKSKNWHFSKGVNPWFWSKNGHFSNFFF